MGRRVGLGIGVAHVFLDHHAYSAKSRSRIVQATNAAQTASRFQAWLPGPGRVGACFRRPRHSRGFLADCVDRSGRLGCCATANPGKGHRGAGQQGENIARSQGVSPRHPGWPRAWLAARGTLVADRHSRCPMGTRDAQRCWPFRRCLMWMRDHT